MDDTKAPEMHRIVQALLARRQGCSWRKVAVELGYPAGSGSALLSDVLKGRVEHVSAARLADLGRRLGVDEGDAPATGSRPAWLSIAIENLRRLEGQARAARARSSARLAVAGLVALVALAGAPGPVLGEPWGAGGVRTETYHLDSGREIVRWLDEPMQLLCLGAVGAQRELTALTCVPLPVTAYGLPAVESWEGR